MARTRRNSISVVDKMTASDALNITIMGLAQASSVDQKLPMIEMMMKIRAAKVDVVKSEPVQGGNGSEAKP
jgi:hypothetical protein